MKRNLTANGASRWSGIDAGRRVQVGSPVTNIRYFRVSGRAVKRDNMAIRRMPFRHSFAQNLVNRFFPAATLPPRGEMVAA